VLVLTANGTAFCAGGDLERLDGMLAQPPDHNRRELKEYAQAYLSVLALDIPTIAALNGDAIGAGISFVLGCDIRLAAENARFGFTYLNIGLHPGMATTHLLPLIVGSSNAADLVLTGRVIRTPEALAMGLVSKVVPGERLMDEAMKLAAQIAAKPASGVRMAKRALARPKLEGLESALDYEATAQMNSYASSEMREALSALRRK
jgi:enoyl-CoA hydratase